MAVGSPLGVYCVLWELWLNPLQFCEVSIQGPSEQRALSQKKKKKKKSGYQIFPVWMKRGLCGPFYVLGWPSKAVCTEVFSYTFAPYQLLNLVCGFFFPFTWKAASLLQNFPELSGVLYSSSPWEEINSHQMPVFLQRSVSKEASKSQGHPCGQKDVMMC